jgi:hypothetical protein
LKLLRGSSASWERSLRPRTSPSICHGRPDQQPDTRLLRALALGKGALLFESDPQLFATAATSRTCSQAGSATRCASVKSLGGFSSARSRAPSSARRLSIISRALPSGSCGLASATYTSTDTTGLPQPRSSRLFAAMIWAMCGAAGSFKSLQAWRWPQARVRAPDGAPRRQTSFPRRSSASRGGRPVRVRHSGRARVSRIITIGHKLLTS